MSRFDRLFHDEAGTTAIEYALIGSLISVACIAAFTRFADSMNFLYAIIDAIAGVMS